MQPFVWSKRGRIQQKVEIETCKTISTKTTLWNVGGG
jgi:hypothetical protein